MASEFIGYNVLVTLQVPPGGKLQGQVADVVGQTLLLKNGKTPVLHLIFTELWPDHLLSQLRSSGMASTMPSFRSMRRPLSISLLNRSNLHRHSTSMHRSYLKLPHLLFPDPFLCKTLLILRS